MQEWYEGSYFPEDLLLRRDGEDTLEPLFELKRRAGAGPKLFLSHIPPRAPPNLSQLPMQPALHQSIQPQNSFEPLNSSPFGSYNSRDLYSPASAVTQSTPSLLPQRQSSLDTYSSISSVNAASVHPPPQHGLDALYPVDSSAPYGTVGVGISPSDRDRIRHRESEDYLRSREQLMSQQQGMSPGVQFSRSGFTNGSLAGHQQAFDQSSGGGSLPQSFNERSGMQQFSNQQPYLTPLDIGNGNFPSRLPPVSHGNTPIDSNHSFSLQHPPQQPSSPWTASQPQSHYQPLSQAPHQFDPAIVSANQAGLGPRSPMYDMRQPQSQQQFGQSLTFGQPEQPLQQSGWQSQPYQPAQPEEWPRSAHPQPQPSAMGHIEQAPNAAPFIGDVGAEGLPRVPPVAIAPQAAPAAPFQPELSPPAEPIVPVKPQPIARPRGDSVAQQQRQRTLVVDIPVVAEYTAKPAPPEVPASAAPTSQPASIAPAVSVPASAPATGPKPSPWATTAPTSSDERPKPTQTQSLRQIQEAEARRAELRKTAERAERAKRAVAAAVPIAPVTDEPSAPVTQSWGLAAPSVSSRPAPPAVEPPANTATPWSKGGPAPKKTLKEIQEEEERQKSQALAAAAVREGAAAIGANVKGYADRAKVRGPLDLSTQLLIRAADYYGPKCRRSVEHCRSRWQGHGRCDCRSSCAPCWCSSCDRCGSCSRQWALTGCSASGRT